MNEAFSNVYEDQARADAYARLEFPGTYYLAYRDLPEIIERHMNPSPGSLTLTDPFGKLRAGFFRKGGGGLLAVDFGCGAGRSTRFLRRLGFEVTGIDISEQMIAKACELDPEGDYRLARGNNMAGLPEGAFDLVLSVFTFDNVPMENKLGLFSGLRGLLTPAGRLVSLVSTPEIYTHEWVSFSTKDFLANRTAKSGDKVFTVMLDVEDRRPVEDVLCLDEDYRRFYAEAGLRVLEARMPLARADEPFEWVNERTVAPWIIYVLARVG